jgi:FixJ family two-component response regulator
MQNEVEPTVTRFMMATTETDEPAPVADTGRAAISLRRSRAEDKQLQKVPIVSIIDDDESVRLAVKSLVRSLGLIAYTFASAEEFLQSTHANDTSCLITDVQLPGMNGVKLQSLVLARGRDMPIIFVTAFPEKRLQRRALEAGAVGFLSKPFDGETLITLVEEALKRGRDT